MKKIVLYCLLPVIILFNFSCGESSDHDSTAYEKTIVDTMTIDSSVLVADQHKSLNSVDWKGTYKGKLPCADCEGIATEIILGTKNSYTIKTSYLGKVNKTVEDTGTFAWNRAGNTITLSGLNNKRNQYFVGENNLTQLDMAGNKITGALAEKYMLTKQVDSAAAADKKSDATLTETYWKLTALMGEAVEKPAEGKKEIYIILKQKDNRLQGFAGCNTIMGVYELKKGNFISFKKVISTMMACAVMKTENDFKKVLTEADNYSISGDNMSLNKAKMAPLASFEAVYLR